MSRASICQCHHLRQCKARQDVPARHRSRRSGCRRRAPAGCGRTSPCLIAPVGLRDCGFRSGFCVRSSCCGSHSQPAGRSLWALSLAMAGEALRFWAAGHLNKSREVTASGPYRWIAHPLYVGSSIMGAGLAIASHSTVVAVDHRGCIWRPRSPRRSAARKRFCERTFGDQYDRYRRASGDAAPARQRAALQPARRRSPIASIARVAGLRSLCCCLS